MRLLLLPRGLCECTMQNRRQRGQRCGLGLGAFSRGAKATAEAAGSRRAGLCAGSAKWEPFGSGQCNRRWDREGLALMG
jgi:hypothetical protein